jgi:Beta-lactamase enzyme family/Bacterial tandem repeat domain 1
VFKVSRLVAVAALAVGAPAGAVPFAAQPDPERAAGVTGWYWQLGRTETQLNDFWKEKKQRITSIEVDSTSPYRFSAVMVRNDGPYARTWSWWFDRDESGVKERVDTLQSRIIDLEPYTVGGKRRFAFVMVKNTGAAEKGWWWNYDLTDAQVTADIDKHKIRLIDVDTYVVNGQRRYSYVGIKNSGVDAKAWWWYPDASAEFVAARLKEFGARLIDVEPTSSGRLAVVMVKNDGTYWWWGHGISASRVEEAYSTHGVRIVDIERYGSSYAFVAADNADEESARLRSYLDKVYDNEKQFGTGVIRGLYVKQLGGPTLAQIGARLRFQPLSTLKLLPYAYAWEQIDQGKATLDSTIGWIEATKDDPNTPIDERDYSSCLTSGAANTRSASAKWGDALPTMMWESHNRTLDAYLARFNPDTLTDRAQKQWGLTSTEMHFGCPRGSNQAPWSANRSTLVELGRLFEGFHDLTIVKKAASRDGFLASMINLTYTGAKYTSPITGMTTGPLYSSYTRDIAKREAGPAKQGIVEDFLKGVVIRGKGGSGGPSSNEFGYSDFLYVTLPFRQGSQTVTKTFVLGWYVYKLKTPSGCPDLPKSQQSASCQAIWEPERGDLWKLKTELFAAPIRMALATWPG